MAKPATGAASEALRKDEGQDPKNFHYIYILKKQPAGESSAPASAPEPEHEEKKPAEETAPQNEPEPAPEAEGEKPAAE